jgi:hypothetical protein
MSYMKNNLLTASAPLSEDSLARQKEQAFSIYLSMTMVRIPPIASKVGVPVELVKQWVSEDNWIGKRALFRQNETEELLKLYGCPKKSAKKVLDLCTLINKQLEEILNNSGYRKTADLQRASTILKTTNEMQTKIYKEAKLI